MTDASHKDPPSRGGRRRLQRERQRLQRERRRLQRESRHLQREGQRLQREGRRLQSERRPLQREGRRLQSEGRRPRNGSNNGFWPSEWSLLSAALRGCPALADVRGFPWSRPLLAGEAALDLAGGLRRDPLAVAAAAGLLPRAADRLRTLVMRLRGGP